MKNFSHVFFLALILSVQLVRAETNVPEAQEIIAMSDDIRNPDRPFQLRNVLTEYENGAVKSEVVLIVLSKADETTGQYKNLIRYIAPPRDAGKMVLLDDTRMWFYDPSSKASVPISPQQRLVGQASEGDVVTVNLAKDYVARLTGIEQISDADRETKKCYRLELLPGRPDAIYARIEYWVEEKSFRPVKGKFYSDSGRLLKIAYYHKYEEQLGKSRPSETIIIDAVNPKLVTTMNFSEYRYREIPENWFQREYLPHVK